ncbi:MAG: V-type ATPase subunit [Oscillospiraceae bacterium]|nr:V-type ATPase subunit [Oscillospiraceae bacterium]
MPMNYHATVALIRSAYGHRLRAADYRNLVNLHSVSEVVSYLKGTAAYGELLAGLEPGYTHRGHLEMLLKRNLFTQCLHFCSLERLSQKPFFRFFIYEYEIRELFKAIQLGDQDYISSMDTWLAPYLCFKQEKLARAGTNAALLDAVAGTPYAPILKRYLPRDDSVQTPAQIPYTELEIALRTDCLNRILKEAEQTMHGDDLEALRGLIGEQVDLINLINAYRLKSVFRADRQTLDSMMLPIAGKLPRRICQALYAAPDKAAFEAVLAETRYGRMLSDLPDIPDAVRVERAFQTLRWRTARNALHFSGHAAVSLYAVHCLNQIEVQNLIAVIEGIRYQKPVSYIRSLLIVDPT